MKADWRRAVLYTAIIGMTGCWLYSWLAMLAGQVADTRLSVAGILALYPAAFIIHRLLKRLDWPRVFIEVISWLGWAASMLLTVKVQLFPGLSLSDPAWLLAIPRAIAGIFYTFAPELLILPGTAVLWWLGRRLASRKLDFAAMVTEFQFGLVMLVIVFLIISRSGSGPGNPVPVVLAFFIFALPGMSLAHAMEGTGWLSGMYRGRWAGLLLLSVGIVLILGLLIGLIVTPDILQIITGAIKTAWAFIWGLFLKLIALIASILPAQEPAEMPSVSAAPMVGPDNGFNLNIPEWLRSGFQLAWLIAFMGLLLVALWRVSSEIIRWLRRRLADTNADYEPIPGAFKTDIIGLLKRLLARVLGLKIPSWLRRKAAPSPPGAASVRQIYRHLLRWATDGGHPRRASQTPQEFCRRLTSLLPESGEDLSLVTQYYSRARYGAAPASEGELSEIGEAWHRLKKIHLKKAGKGPDYESEVI